MKKSDRIPRPRTRATRAALAFLLVSTGARVVLALDAPLKATGPVIDGTIEQPFWGPERTGAMAGCQFMRVFALRTSTHYYLAVDVPEVAPHPDDMLALYFDANHDADATPDPADHAVRLLGFPGGSNQSPTSALHYLGNGSTTWAAPSALGANAARSSRAGSGTSARLVVEVEIPVSAAPSGFALLYLSGGTTHGDCDSDFIQEASFTWPVGLPVPASVPDPGLTDASVWDDIGRRSPPVGFAPPTCCHSADVTFTPNIQPFTAGVPVNITARAHNADPDFEAKSVKVRIRVHKFGTGGGIVFDTSPSDPVIANIGTSTNASTSPVTWASPSAGLHGCIRAEVQPATESATTSLDDYAVGANAMAQHNIDVACVVRRSKRAMKFMMANPDPGKEQRIFLVKRERLPGGHKGLTFELAQLDRPLRPKEEFEATLVAMAREDVPVTKPWKRLAVPPTAGGTERGAPDAPEEAEAAAAETPQARVGPQRLEVKAGARLHVMTSGEVDIDGSGPVPAVGPEGRDVSKEVPRGRFLLASKAARLYGGALIGSFDGFRTSFALGREATVTVPARATVLSLAVNDLARRHGDNTGKGFAVEVFAVPLRAGKETRVPEVDVFATTRNEVRIGDRRYAVGRILGGVTYQMVVMP